MPTAASRSRVRRPSAYLAAIIGTLYHFSNPARRLSAAYAVAFREGSYAFGQLTGWYARHGDWLRRGVLAVAVYFLAHFLLGLWPVFNPQVLILWSLLVALVGFWQPSLALPGLLIGIAASLLQASGALALAFSVLWVLVLIVPKISDTTLKLALVLGAPLAFQHGWFFLAAMLLGLVYGSRGTLPAAFAAVFALLVDWLEGAHIVGVLPPHASLVAASPLSMPFFSWVGSHLKHPDPASLFNMIEWIQPHIVPALSELIIVSLAARAAGALRKGRGLGDDSLAVGLVSLGAWAAWTTVADGFHPSAAVALAILPPTLIGAVGALALGRLFPSDDLEGSDRGGAAERRLRKAGWEDIAGYEDVKRELREAIQPYADRTLRRKLESQGLPPVRGVLLYGPPGTGKTLMARVLASESRLHLIGVSGPEFFSKWVGDSEAKLRNLFQQARDRAPSLIFFDEVESFLPPRDRVGSDTGGGQASQRVVATFLSEMDGLLERGDVLVVAATNDPDQIDPAAIRPGRFDQVIFVPPPDADARRAIFALALQDRAAIDIEPLVQATERYTAADIFGVVTNAYRAATHRGTSVTQEELLALFHDTKPTVSLHMLDLYEKLADKYGRRSQVAPRAETVTHRRLGWDDIGGMEDVKTALREAVELPLLYPDRFKEWGVQPHKGILLYGPSGCGKTMFAKVVSDTAQARFYTVNGPELLGGGPGAAEQRLRQLFDIAKENRPAVVFFDEVDAIAGQRDSLAGSLQGSIVQQLLTLLDGKDALNGVVVIAATNRPDHLDPALLRPGRLDRLIYVSLPDPASRLAQWRIHLAGKPGADHVDYDALAAASDGYTGAEIQHIANRVALTKLKASLSDGSAAANLTTKDVLAGLREVSRQVSPEEVAAFEAIARELRR